MPFFRPPTLQKDAPAIHMSLNSLVLCSDEKIVRVLRRCLGDLEIAVELCSEASTALRKLTRRRFEAIVVDCSGEGAAEVLRGARNAPCNRQAVAVAIVEPTVGLGVAFGLGAHFVLYKPVSSERARSSFRAARALMKSERRRNVRVAVQIPVSLRSLEGAGEMKLTTADLSEGGMAVRVTTRKRPRGRWQVSFILPGKESSLQLVAEFAWEGTGTLAGVRFVDLPFEAACSLREWLSKNSSDIEQDDPPVHCRLTDLSLGGCYLELASPFPPSTRVLLSMRAAAVEVRTQGVVRVMHPEKGMGVEFTQKNVGHRAALEHFLEVLSENRSLTPELLVEPEGLEPRGLSPTPADADDPLLQLFYGEPMPAEDFEAALQQQRASAPQQELMSSPVAVS